MADNFLQSISKSAIQFNDLCVPILKKIIDGDFMSIEGKSTDEHKKMLDIQAGIDAWRYNKNGVRGVASRIQNGKAYNTFTVRKERDNGSKTEYEKRAEAIKYDYLYPHYTMQAYINDNTVLSLAICKTTSLFEKINNGYYNIRYTGTDKIGGASFCVVKWSEFKNDEIRIYNINAFKKEKY